MHLSAFRKKGSIFILSLFSLIAIFVITAFLLSIINMVENYESTHKIVDVVGKTRVQAVDIPLKEQYGIIEVIHSPEDYDSKPVYMNEDGENVTNIYENDEYYNEEDFRSDTATAGYDQAIITKSNPLYKAAALEANEIAINAGLTSLENTFKNFKKEGLSFIDASAENFCIKVFPLPKGEKAEKVKLSCDAKVLVDGELQTVTISSVRRVNGIDHNLNYDESVGITNKELRVYNAVYVGFAYLDNKSLFFNFFENAFGVTPGIRTVSQVVYPQIDAISFGDGWD